jgi:hypothetical protein
MTSGRGRIRGSEGGKEQEGGERRDRVSRSKDDVFDDKARLSKGLVIACCCSASRKVTVDRFLGLLVTKM